MSEHLCCCVMVVAEDEATAARISSKNGLESYACNLRNSLAELESAVKETLSWLDNSQEASKDEYESKQKELEDIAKYVYF
jgi:heat shock protein 1/8